MSECVGVGVSFLFLDRLFLDALYLRGSDAESRTGRPSQIRFFSLLDVNKYSRRFVNALTSDCM